ncbi:hypothetical protein [Cytobacillus horneckiae]|uniref:Head-tail adaptor protein n=1 Tax=Cytobacillus horneckiae TaxID=549687 RepID=A0A2N0ZFC0_9BACI|nr:hypothetical protein [Cytobacillus horneckiae]MEC1155654.1 hypothetical protein [Cytobacillus horneckiae]MED2936972.1 hypothetical protein [Cytobacillus horneckiae]PKG28205.1 hypothetical protein CWS20_15290 [Cytobacillus horneckiae]
MKKDKTGYIYTQVVLRDEEGNVITDDYGRPVMDYIPNIPFIIRSWQPYSPQMASDRYAIRVPEVNYRFFSDPDDRLDFKVRFSFRGNDYRIEYPLKYERHYEILITELKK